MKKVFVLLICILTMMISTPCFCAYAVDIAPWSGVGTLESPYQISNENDLKELSTRVNGGNDYQGKFFEMSNNINLEEAWIPIGIYDTFDEYKAFQGSFNGAQYEISNVLVNTDTIKTVGLFGYLGSNGVIQNVKVSGEIKSTYIYSAGGGIAGKSSGTINNCHNEANITARAAGGIVGWAYDDSKVENCSNNAIITCNGSYNVAGIVAHNQGIIRNSYTKGSILSGTYRGGISGFNAGTIRNCYVAAIMDSEDIPGYGGIGGIVNQNGGIVENCYWDVEITQLESGIGKNIDGASATGCEGYTSAEMKSDTLLNLLNTNADALGDEVFNWERNDDENSGYPTLKLPAPPVTAADSFSGGDGSKEFPYQIAKAEELLKLSNDVNAGNNYSGVCFIITSDIDLAAIDNWTPIGNHDNKFHGKLDGLGHEISNMTVDRDNYAGLFGVLGIGSTVENLTVSGCVKGKHGVGGICGENTGLVQNCSNKAEITGEDDYVGGIVGGVYEPSNGDGGAIVRNCVNYGDVKSSLAMTVGGISGYNSRAKIINCYNMGNVSGNKYIGGIVGTTEGLSYTQNCYNIGIVTGNEKLGGIVGCSSGGTINGCYYLKDSAPTSLYGVCFFNSYGTDGTLLKNLNNMLDILENTQLLVWTTGTNGYPVFSNDYWVAPSYTLTVNAPSFDDVEYGYTQPDAKAITITSTGNRDSTISDVSISGSDFVISGSATTVTAGGQISDYTIRPVEGLSAGLHKSVITVRYNNGATVSDNIIFNVNGIEMTGVSATGYTGVYDGTSHSITVNYPEGATIKFKTSISASYYEYNPLITNAGNYTVYFKISKENYRDYEGSAAVIIEKKAIPVPILENDSFEYNGLLQRISLPSSKYYYFEGQIGATIVGNYLLSAKLKSTNNTRWENEINNNDTANKAITWKITRAPIDIPSVATNLVYKGQEQTCISDGDKYVVLSNNKATNAGNYYVEIGLINSNYMWSDNTMFQKRIKWSIAKAPLTIKADNKLRVYGEENPSFTFTVQDGGLATGDNFADLGINAFTSATKTSNVGEYTISGNSNSTNYDVTVNNGVLTVKKAKLSIGDVSVEDKTYDGTNNAKLYSYGILGEKNHETLRNGVDYHISAQYDNANVGQDKNVVVAVNLLDTYVTKNYELPINTKAFTGNIIAKELIPTLSYKANSMIARAYDKTTNFNGDAKIVLEGVIEGEKPTVTATYSFSNADVEDRKTLVASSISFDSTNLANANYRLSKTTALVDTKETLIKKAVIIPPTFAENLIYNGEAQSVVSDGDFYSVSGNTATNAGNEYSVILKLDDANNYKWLTTDNSLNIMKSWTIKALPVVLTWNSYTDLAYDGKAKNVTAIVSNLCASDSCTALVDNGTEANSGTYIATVKSLSNSNYTLIDGINTSKQYIINKKPLSEVDIAEIGDFDYKGNEYAPKSIVSYNNGTDTIILTSTDFYYSYNNNVNAGEAIVTITAVDGSNYIGTKSTTFTINKKVLTPRISYRGSSAISREYNGKTNFNGVAEIILDGAVMSQKPIAIAEYAFTNADVEDKKEITASGIALTDDDVNKNYTLNGVTNVAVNTNEKLIVKANLIGKPIFDKITSGNKHLSEVIYNIDEIKSSEGSVIDGTVNWVNNNGSVINDATIVKANYMYTWRFTPNDTNNYNELLGQLQIYPVSNKSNSEYALLTGENEDVNVKERVNILNGEARIQIQAEDIKRIVNNEKFNGRVTINVRDLKHEADKVTLPAEVVNTMLKSGKETSLQIETSVGRVNLNEESLKQIVENEDVRGEFSVQICQSYNSDNCSKTIHELAEKGAKALKVSVNAVIMMSKGLEI